MTATGILPYLSDLEQLVTTKAEVAQVSAIKTLLLQYQGFLKKQEVIMRAFCGTPSLGEKRENVGAEQNIYTPRTPPRPTN